jgi:hypothetical protein
VRPDSLHHENKLTTRRPAGADNTGDAMADLGFLIGALVPTFLLSRLLLWLTRGWSEGGVRRLLVCHAASLLVAAFLGGIGMADGGAFAGIEAAARYALPQAFWLAVDLWRLRRATTLNQRRHAAE